MRRRRQERLARNLNEWGEGGRLKRASETDAFRATILWRFDGCETNQNGTSAANTWEMLSLCTREFVWGILIDCKRGLLIFDCD